MAEKERWMKVRMIVEVAGFPKEYIEQTIVLLGEKFAENNSSVKVTKRMVREPQQIKDSKIWSGFIEFHCDVESLVVLMGLIFDYMPSSVEIISPDVITEDNFKLNGLLNDLAGRLHQYDAAIKTLKAEKTLLGKKIKKTDKPAA
jgi:hypothetical protein